MDDVVALGMAPAVLKAIEETQGGRPAVVRTAFPAIQDAFGSLRTAMTVSEGPPPQMIMQVGLYDETNVHQGAYLSGQIVVSPVLTAQRGASQKGPTTADLIGSLRFIVTEDDVLRMSSTAVHVAGSVPTPQITESINIAAGSQKEIFAVVGKAVEKYLRHAMTFRNRL